MAEYNNYDNETTTTTTSVESSSSSHSSVATMKCTDRHIWAELRWPSIVALFFGSIFIIAVLSTNLLVLVSVARGGRHSLLRSSPTCMLLASICVLNAASAMVIMPVSGAQMFLTSVDRPWPLPWWHCRLWTLVDIWLCCALSATIVAIAIDRCIATLWPLDYTSKLLIAPRARRLVVAMWIFGLAASILPHTRYFRETEPFRSVPPTKSRRASRFSFVRALDTLPLCSCEVFNAASGFAAYIGVMTFVVPFFVTAVVYAYVFIYSKATHTEIKRINDNGGVLLQNQQQQSGSSIVRRRHLADLGHSLEAAPQMLSAAADSARRIASEQFNYASEKVRSFRRSIRRRSESDDKTSKTAGGGGNTQSDPPSKTGDIEPDKHSQQQQQQQQRAQLYRADIHRDMYVVRRHDPLLASLRRLRRSRTMDDDKESTAQSQQQSAINAESSSTTGGSTRVRTSSGDDEQTALVTGGGGQSQVEVQHHILNPVVEEGGNNSPSDEVKGTPMRAASTASEVASLKKQSSRDSSKRGPTITPEMIERYNSLNRQMYGFKRQDPLVASFRRLRRQPEVEGDGSESPITRTAQRDSKTGVSARVASALVGGGDQRNFEDPEVQSPPAAAAALSQPESISPGPCTATTSQVTDTSLAITKKQPLTLTNSGAMPSTSSAISGDQKSAATTVGSVTAMRNAANTTRPPQTSLIVLKHRGDSELLASSAFQKRFYAEMLTTRAMALASAVAVVGLFLFSAVCLYVGAFAVQSVSSILLTAAICLRYVTAITLPLAFTCLHRPLRDRFIHVLCSCNSTTAEASSSNFDHHHHRHNTTTASAAAVRKHSQSQQPPGDNVAVAAAAGDAQKPLPGTSAQKS